MEYKDPYRLLSRTICLEEGNLAATQHYTKGSKIQAPSSFSKLEEVCCLLVLCQTGGEDQQQSPKCDGFCSVCKDVCFNTGAGQSMAAPGCRESQLESHAAKLLNALASVEAEECLTRLESSSLGV